LNLISLVGRQQQEPWVAPGAAPPGDTLKKYARDLTQAAREGKLDDVIGRDAEIRRTMQGTELGQVESPSNVLCSTLSPNQEQPSSDWRTRRG